MSWNKAAFPMVIGIDTDEHDPGMSLRAYFAAAALTGLAGARCTEDLKYDEIAWHAWKFADAMMKVEGDL